MATPTPPVRQGCVLRVWIKCCKGCQTKAKTKLLTVPGVSGVEYNAEQGLLTVSGDANPQTLLRKLTKWGKTAELVSDITGSVPQHSQTKTMEKKNNNKRPTKCCLLRCFGKRSSKTKVQPCRGAWAENATAVSPPMVYPPPRAMPGFASPIPYPPPYFGASQPPPYTAGMFRPPPPQSPPYFQTQFPLMVHSRLHYPPLP